MARGIFLNPNLTLILPCLEPSTTLQCPPGAESECFSLVFTGLHDPDYSFLTTIILLWSGPLHFSIHDFGGIFWHLGGHLVKLPPWFKTLPWLPISLRAKAKDLPPATNPPPPLCSHLLTLSTSLALLQPHWPPCWPLNTPDKAFTSPLFQSYFLCQICCSLTYPHRSLPHLASLLISLPSPVSFYYHL